MWALIFTASLDKLDEARSFLTGGLPEEFASITSSVELIFEEFFVNIVNHAYQGQSGPFEVSLRQVLFDDWPHLAMKVVDWGPAFDPFTEAKAPDLNQDIDLKTIGGYGVHLVRNIAAHYSYFRDRGANTVEVWVRRP
jgi:anti-sigma regulatory factor (Ser/Thr protein kinase)